MASQSQLREQVQGLKHLPIKDICALTGATYNQVWRATQGLHRPQITESDVNKMIYLRLLGHTVEQVSRVFKRNPATVSKLTSRVVNLHD